MPIAQAKAPVHDIPPQGHGRPATQLTRIYAMLKVGGDLSRTEHLAVELKDYHECRDFTGASSMVDLVMRHLQRLLTNEIHQ